MTKGHTLLALLYILFLGACSSPKEKSFFDQLELKTMEGKILTVSDLDGKPAFINFWATWCKPCLQEMPSIENVKAILEKEGYVIIAVSNEDKGRIQGFIDQNDYSFEFAQFALGLESLNIYSLPASYIVDAKGDLLFEHMGARKWDDEENLKLFRSYLKN